MPLNVSVALNVLRADVILSRREKCRGCEHVMMFPWPQHERVYSCDLLHDAAKPRRHPSHYLRLYVEQPANACPDGRWDAASEVDLRRPDEAPLKGESVYEVLWREIHDPKRHWDQKFVDSVRLRLRCGDCKEHFKNYCKAQPPPLGDDAACWVWGVLLHDAINELLSKPIMGLDAARARYRA